jgi:3-oxoacyl-[acyl-carrier protein] reductase
VQRGPADPTPLPGRFAGKVAVVTGSSADPSIGRSCAERLGREGASVVLNGRRADLLGATERALAAEGLAVAAVVGSMEDDGTAERLVAAALEHFGRIDLLVSTVGGAPHRGPLTAMTRQDLVGTLALNTWPAVALVQAAMAAGLGDGAAVVNISSGSPKKATPDMAAYAAAKAALNALTRTMAASLAPAGVRVNAVSPGLTKTSGTRRVWSADDGAAAGANLLTGRLTGADDVAAAVLFLLSDDARQITGTLLDVDGGNHLGAGGWSPYGPGGDLRGPTPAP